MASDLNWSLLVDALLRLAPQGASDGAIYADITVLSGLLEGAEYVHELIGPQLLQTQLREALGTGVVVARLGQGFGNNPPFVLMAISTDEAVHAANYPFRKGQPKL